MAEARTKYRLNNPEKVSRANLFAEVTSVFGPHIQILPSSATDRVTHWICTYFDGNVIHVYDSLPSVGGLTSEQINFLRKLFPHQPRVIYEQPQQQQNAYDCGVFAIAFAVSVANGLNPVSQNVCTRLLRPHMITIFQNKSIEPFPTEISYTALKKK
ncbi:hypothetical protein J437_LFUL016255 [Ladona fulva]|uniref:Ubiquitin-like protease family profile domain-containing protein n=1 Tax=Ladona fulva TaxID=123851 RepID=A0A8K0KNA7_LADFU|nr:hypothetical protein J437_LFUL016255 [Ladona fulva]